MCIAMDSLIALPSLSAVAKQWLREAPDEHFIASAINEYVDRVTQPQTRGALSEHYVMHLLSKHWSVRSVGHVAHSCDLYLDNEQVFVEVKSYKSTVPMREVEKFLSDIALRKPRSAVFLSLSSPVARTQPYMDVQWHQGIPVVLCGDANDVSVLSSVRVACALASYRKVATARQDSTTLERLCVNVIGSVQQLSECRATLEMIEKMVQKTIATMSMMEQSVQVQLETLERTAAL